MSMEIRWGVCTLLHAMHNIQCIYIYIYIQCVYIYIVYDTLQYNTLHIYIYTHARHIYYGGVLKCYLHIPGFFLGPTVRPRGRGHSTARHDLSHCCAQCVAGIWAPGSTHYLVAFNYY